MNYNQNAVDSYNQLISILEKMPIPEKRRNILKQTNVRWLRRSIQPAWEQAEVALKILETCDETAKGNNISPIYQYTLMNHYINEETFVKKYLEKGLSVYSNVRVGKPHKVYKVQLPFTPEEWMDLMNIEGEFLPACCAVISDVRSTLMATLREGGYIRATDLHAVVEALKEHHDCSDDNEPQSRLIKIWDDIKDEADLHIAAIKIDPNNLDDAFDLLYRSSSNLSWGKLFSKSPEEEKDHGFFKLLEYARVLPAIKTIHESLIEQKIPPLEGFAVAENDQVVVLRNNGLAIYATEEKANEFADALNEREKFNLEYNKKEKIDNVYRNKKFDLTEEPRLLNVSKFVVKKVCVSLENGIVFI